MRFFFTILGLLALVASPLSARRSLVTACNDAYFNRCLTLIASVHRTSFDVVDEICVYSLNLSKEKVDQFSKIQKVRVVFFEEIQEKFPEMDIAFFYEKPGTCAWKQVCVHDAAQAKGDLVFWLDAGAMLLQSAEEIYQIIERDDIFLVVDPSNYNYTWSHPKSIEILKATPEELKDYQLCAGIHGYKKGGAYQAMMDEALRFSLIKACVDGHRYYDYGMSPVGEPILGHRQDQTILSILSARYCAPKQNLSRYGEWRSFLHCLDNDSVIWVHRGTFKNHRDIRY